MKKGVKAIVFFAQDLLQCELHLPGVKKNPPATFEGSLLTQNIHDQHIDTLATRGQTGLLHLRKGRTGTEKNGAWVLRQVLGMHGADCREGAQAAGSDGGGDDDISNDGYSKDGSGDKIANLINQRHSGMKFAIWSDENDVIEWVRDEMGHRDCSLFPGESINGDNDVKECRNDSITWGIIAKKLSDPKTDVLLVHWKPRGTTHSRHALVQKLNELVGDSLQHHSEQYNLHITLMMSHRCPPPLLESEEDDNNNGQSTRRPPFMPVQSYEVYHGRRVHDVDPVPRIMFSSYLDGVTRKDRNEHFREESCSKLSGLGSILADHFFDEISYTVGYAPKYGA